jgi:geranylgeranyl diphosphate synthase type II
MQTNDINKVNSVLSIFRACGVDQWAMELKDKYLQEALVLLEDIAVLSKRKDPLLQLALFLTNRQQ